MQVEVDPLSAEDMIDVLFEATFGVAIYSAKDTAGTDKTKEVAAYEFTMPKAETSIADMMEPLDDFVTDQQVIVDQSRVADVTAADGTVGSVTQWLFGGFEINPLNDQVSDKLFFYLEMDAPKTFIPKGSRLFQFATFQQKDSTEKPISVGCATKVGDEYVTEVFTWKGSTSLKETSAAVKGQTYSSQNIKEMARLKDSFELAQESAWYRTEDSWIAEGTNYYQPCMVVLDMGRKLPADDPFFGSYTVTYGARVYSSDQAKTFTSIPSIDFEMNLGQPETDLAAIYEEDEPEEQAETVEYLSEKQRYNLADLYGDN